MTDNFEDMNLQQSVQKMDDFEDKAPTGLI